MHDDLTSRRGFLGRSGAAVMGALAAGCAASGPERTGSPAELAVEAVARGTEAAGQPASARPAPPERLVVSTWRFGQAANVAAWAALAAGVEHPFEACVAGVQVTEADPGVSTVGLGGRPNAEGVVELDAAVMRGDTLACGGVAGLQRVFHPVAVARDVMLHTPHVLLVGDGALQFARLHGHAEGELLTEATRAAWERWKATQDAPPSGPEAHDTIGMIALERGRLATAVTTSGWAYKLPGRAGDSPIVGAGSYCDDDVGACVASGDGEEMIRTSASFAVVEGLRHGLSVEDALTTVLVRIRERAKRRGASPYVALLAVDRAGRAAALATGKGFQFAITDATGTRLVDSPVHDA